MEEQVWEKMTTIKTLIMKIIDNKIILEANEGFNVGIYDEKGLVKWSFIEALTANYPPGDFIFEVPLELQQSAMIAEFGQRVNLALLL